MNQEYKNTRSMQEKEPQVDSDPEISLEDRTDYTFAKIVESGQIHIDLTGKFPTSSSRGNTYVLILYAYYPNTTTTDHMKNRGDK
jgi:hypothetical protein